jgi:hypothetical protein
LKHPENQDGKKPAFWSLIVIIFASAMIVAALAKRKSARSVRVKLVAIPCPPSFRSGRGKV